MKGRKQEMVSSHRKARGKAEKKTADKPAGIVKPRNPYRGRERDK